MENASTITPGDIQVMSTGRGIFHSEYNGSDTEDLQFLQIWVFPKVKNTPPEYHNYDVRSVLKKNHLGVIIAPDGSAPASILQDAWFSMGKFDAGQTIDYKCTKKATEFICSSSKVKPMCSDRAWKSVTA